MPKLLTPMDARLKKVRKKLKTESKSATGKKKADLERDIAQLTKIIADMAVALRTYNLC